MAKQRTIEIEAESFAEAQRQLRSQIPKGMFIHMERIMVSGGTKTVKATADTTELAFEIAQKEIPIEASEVKKKILTSPERRAIIVEAFDEQTASALIADKVKGTDEVIKTTKLKAIGNKGLLGVGKKPNQYEADIHRQALVEVTYNTKAKIYAELGDKTSEVNFEILGNKNDELATSLIYKFCDLFGKVTVTSNKMPIIASAKISKPSANQAMSKIEGSSRNSKDFFSLLLEFFPDLLQEIFDEQFKMGTQNIITGSALHRLLFTGKFSAAELLVEKGENPNTKNSDGKTPLHLCVDDSIVDSKKCVEVLIAHGADINATDTNGDTPLHIAISNCDNFIERIKKVAPYTLTDYRLKAVEFLIEQGADINKRNKKGFTPFSNIKTSEMLDLCNSHGGVLDLHTASSIGAYDKVIDLINTGSDINLKDGNGRTPIYLATESRQTSIVKVLLEYGADPNIQAQQPIGWTPLHLAAWEDLSEIAQILVEHGADRLIREPARNMTPLEIAKERRSSKVAYILDPKNF